MNAVRTLTAAWLVLFSTMAFAQAVRELPDFTRLVDDQGNAVVNISTTQAVRRSGAVPQVPGMEDEEVLEFFRRFIPRQQPGPSPRPEARSLGSGFIISADGYILTNAHVVEGADDINVRFTDKREFKAKVIGLDRRTDIAVIKIESPQQLPAGRFSTCAAKWSASTRRSTAAPAASWAFPSPSRSTSRSTSRSSCARRAASRAAASAW